MFRISRLALAGFSAAQIESKLKASDALAPLLDVTVVDASGGCGSFYNITVASPVFAGKSLIQQHRIVNEVLKEEIKEIHGFTLSTATEAPEPT